MKKTILSIGVLFSMLVLSHIPSTETGSTANSTTTKNDPAVKTIKLYTYPSCPHCHTVINFLKKRGWYDRVVIVNADEEQNYKELKRLRNDGKDYCPFLVDQVHDKNMGESRKIMDYLKEIFSEADDAI